MSQTHTAPSFGAIALVSLLAAGLTGCASTAAPTVGAAPTAPAADVVAVPGVALDAQSGASATVPAADVPDDGEEWTYSATALGWLPGIKGTTTGNGSRSRVDLGVSDVWDIVKNSLDKAVLGKLEARRGEWSLYGSAFAIELLDKNKFTIPNSGGARGETRVKVDITLIEAGVKLDMGTIPDIDVGAGPLSYEALVGARYYGTDLEIEIKPIAKAQGPGFNFIDPIVGLEAVLPIAEQWTLSGHGDVGGFGIGEASDSSWRLQGVIGFHPSDSVHIYAGWNTLSFVNQKGPRVRRDELDLRLSGPVVGATFDF